MQLSSLQCSTKPHTPWFLRDTSFIFADLRLLSGTTGCHFAASRIWPAGEAAPSLDDSLCLTHKHSNLVNKTSSPWDPKRAGSRVGYERKSPSRRCRKSEEHQYGRVVRTLEARVWKRHNALERGHARREEARWILRTTMSTKSVYLRPVYLSSQLNISPGETPTIVLWQT